MHSICRDQSCALLDFSISGVPTVMEGDNKVDSCMTTRASVQTQALSDTGRIYSYQRKTNSDCLDCRLPRTWRDRYDGHMRTSCRCWSSNRSRSYLIGSQCRCIFQTQVALSSATHLLQQGCKVNPELGRPRAVRYGVW